jgi:PIN domain nuclease of toxin-antitoxin system
VKYLLDTHAFFWWITNAPQLTPNARTTIGSPSSDVFVSAVTALEIASKVRIGKWPEAAIISQEIEQLVEVERFLPLPISIAHARLAGELAHDHRDPFDRLLAAQAISDNLAVITNDRLIANLGAITIW